MNSYILDFRNQDVGGAVTSGHLFAAGNGTDTDWNGRLQEFTAATRGMRLLVLVHGYNNSRKLGRKRLLRFAGILRDGGCEDTILSILWPGDGWAKALSYPFEGRDADDTADALARWLSTNAAPDASLAFVGHSLGCRVVMRTAHLLARKGGFQLDRICLMAPAIDNDCLGRKGTACYKEATIASDRIAVLASEEDKVLHYAYPLGDLAQTILYNEHWGRALGRTGPKEKDSRIVDRIEPVPKADPAREIDHSDYLDVTSKRARHTIAKSDQFILQFLNRTPHPNWPAQR